MAPTYAKDDDPLGIDALFDAVFGKQPAISPTDAGDVDPLGIGSAFDFAFSAGGGDEGGGDEVSESWSEASVAPGLSESEGTDTDIHDSEDDITDTEGVDD